MTKLCGFGKRAGSPNSRTQPAPLPLPVDLLIGHILLSSVAQGNQNAMQRWDVQTMSPEESFIQESDGKVLMCMATL